MIEATMVGVRRAVLAALGAIDPVTWMLAAAIAIGTNLSDFAVVPAPGEPPRAAFFVAVAARVALVFWISFALPRRIAGVARPYAVTRGFWPFALLLFLLMIGSGAAQRLLLGSVVDELPLERQWLLMLIGAAAWGGITIRLAAWQAHLALDGPVRSLGALFSAQKGVTFPILLAFIALILPLAAIHLALTLIAVKLVFPPATFAALAVVDGAVQTVQLALTAALSVVALRLALQPTVPSR